MKKEIYIPLLMAIFLIVVFFFVSKTITSVLVFIPATFISYLICVKSFSRQTPEPSRILPLYLVALAIQMIHFMEEYIGEFISRVPALFDQEPYPMLDWIILNMVAYFFFILGGVIIFKRIKELMIIPIFFILVGVILNPIGHILASVYSGEYFPGLYTALIYVFIAPMMIKRLRPHVSTLI